MKTKNYITKVRSQFKSSYYYLFWGAATVGVIAGDPYVCTPVAPVNINPVPIPPCPAGTRTVKAEVNTTVLIDQKYPVVEGDVVKLLESEDRPLTGPYQQPRIIIGSNID